MQSKALLLLGLLVAAGTFTAYNYESSAVPKLTAKEQKIQTNNKFRERIEEFGEFKKGQAKNYNDDYEESYRMSLFIKNEEEIETYNANTDADVQLGVNEYSDMTDDEFGQTHYGAMMPMEDDYMDEEVDGPLEESEQELEQSNCNDGNGSGVSDRMRIDYRYLGSRVRNQKCGDCWANAATAVAEMNFTHDFHLSVQDVMDCCGQKYYSNGCNGGQISHSLQYIIDKGIAQEYHVPYKNGREDRCKNVRRLYLPRDTKKVSFYSWNQRKPQCDTVKKMLKDNGPLNIGVYAEQSVHWRNYKTGIAQHSMSESWVKKPFNHAVVLVGYSDKYWLIQNSWGTHWGYGGYMRIKMGNYFHICYHAAGFVSRDQRHKLPKGSHKVNKIYSSR